MLGVQSVCRDYGREVSIVVGSDSSVAKDVLDRFGLGEIEHLESGLLWTWHVAESQVFNQEAAWREVQFSECRYQRFKRSGRETPADDGWSGGAV